MSRYLVDVTCTFAVECDSPADLEAAVTDVLDVHSPLELRDWRLDETFTVDEP